jgi:dihydrofolate reductase
MGLITSAHSVSVDGFIADASFRGDRLQTWLRTGDTPSRLNPAFTMWARSARFFDEGVGRCGAVISGRRTYEVSDSWGGHGPMPPLPLFVVTHRVPEQIPDGDPAYTFVTDGVESAIEQAQRAASGKDVVLMGASMVQQAVIAGLLDEIVISVVPITLGAGVRLLEGFGPETCQLDVTSVVAAPGVTHLTYAVLR